MWLSKALILVIMVYVRDLLANAFETFLLCRSICNIGNKPTEFFLFSFRFSLQLENCEFYYFDSVQGMKIK